MAGMGNRLRYDNLILTLECGPDGDGAEAVTDAFGDGDGPHLPEARQHFLPRQHVLEQFQVLVKDRLRFVEDH